MANRYIYSFSAFNNEEDCLIEKFMRLDTYKKRGWEQLEMENQNWFDLNVCWYGVVPLSADRHEVQFLIFGGVYSQKVRKTCVFTSKLDNFKQSHVEHREWFAEEDGKSL